MLDNGVFTDSGQHLSERPALYDCETVLQGTALGEFFEQLIGCLPCFDPIFASSYPGFHAFDLGQQDEKPWIINYFLPAKVLGDGLYIAARLDQENSFLLWQVYAVVLEADKLKNDGRDYQQ